MEKEEKLKKLAFYFLKLLLWVFAFALVIYISLSFYAAKKEKEALSLWQKEGIDLIQRKSNLKNREENESAKEVLKIAEKLGIKSDLRETCNIKYKVLNDYSKNQLEKEKLEFLQPNGDTVKILNEIKDDLLKLSEIVEKQKPIWQRQSKYTENNDYAMVLLQLTRILSAETVYSLSMGKNDEAIKFFKTQLSLAESIEPQSIIESIVTAACYRYIYGCARFFPFLENEIIERLSSFNPVQFTKEGSINEVIKLDFSENPEEIMGKKNFFLSSFLAKPYLKLDRSEYLIFSLLLIKTIESQNPCELHDKDISKKIFEKIPRWSVIAKIAIPNLQDMWCRTYHLEVLKQLTVLVLKAKITKAESGSFPETMEVGKSICPNTSFRYVKEGEKIKIFFDGQFKANIKGLNIPLSWEE